jgi:hypothetical protein
MATLADHMDGEVIRRRIERTGPYREMPAGESRL